MTRLSAFLFCLSWILGPSVFSVCAQQTFNALSRHEIELLLSDVGKNNPVLLKRLADDSKLRKQQVENLKQLLAFASQAQKEGFADEPINKGELRNIRAELIAVTYAKDVIKNQDLRLLGSVTENQVNAYWANPAHEAAFDKFLETKLLLLKNNDPSMRDKVVTDDERLQARDVFAKTHILLSEYETALWKGLLPDEFIEKTALQVKLQQVQFLSRVYSQRAAGKLKATDSEIAAYIAADPELDKRPRRKLAQQILERIRAGGSFAELANQFSQDPGNQGPNGEPNGGLYRNVRKGQMVKAFEDAALALRPGRVASNPIETDFGFHIIKLERALGQAQGRSRRGQSIRTYDVRHILISTMVRDSNDTNAREMPLVDYARSMVEGGKVAQLVLSNHILVAEDFVVPTIPEPSGKKDD